MNGEVEYIVEKHSEDCCGSPSVYYRGDNPVSAWLEFMEQCMNTHTWAEDGTYVLLTANGRMMYKFARYDVSLYYEISE